MVTSSSYRIGFLNPWQEKAENQAFLSLVIAAERIGQQIINVTNSDEIIAANLDFLLAVHPLQPKTTDVPTFGVIHSPRALLLDYDYYGQTLLTYDGYLTIMDTIDRFLRGICAGTRRAIAIGFYYNSPQRQFLKSSVEKLVELQALRLCYFGTNWDARARALFRALADRPYMRIYGPAGAWDYLGSAAYHGSVPFDGQSVQRVYATFGAGLVVLSRHHALDDVVSNRIFEITSVGAVAICPDIPWIRKYFGDTVLYYNSFNSTAAVVREIDQLIEEIIRNPRAMASRALAARSIFEEKFAAEVMIQNAVNYFEEWRTREGKQSDPTDDPLIDVIVRVGGRPISTVLRAIRSIDSQTAGRFRVIFVRYRPIDLADVIGASWARIQAFEVIDRPGGSRATTLTAGLEAVRNDFFGVLDDDDFWLSGHIRGLLTHIDECAPNRAYAYSGYLIVEEAPGDEMATARERRKIGSMAPASGDISRIGASFAPHCWLASSALLRFVSLKDWTLSTAEDSVLQASLMSRADCVFSYRATACSVRGSHEASNWENTPTRDEDVFEFFTRVYSSIDRIERKFPVSSRSNWATLNWALQRALETKSKVLAANATILVVGDGAIGTSIHDRDDLELKEIPLTPERVRLAGQSRFGQYNEEPAIMILAEQAPWTYGVSVPLERSDLYSGGQFVVLELGALAESIGAGLLDKLGRDFKSRVEVPVSHVPVEVWLQVPDPEEVSAIVISNWEQPSVSCAVLRKAWVARTQDIRI